MSADVDTGVRRRRRAVDGTSVATKPASTPLSAATSSWPQWLVLAVLSGTLAACTGVFAKM
jgi:uncharacterized protein involved in exopolysaccharide biosynthesis